MHHREWHGRAPGYVKGRGGRPKGENALPVKVKAQEKKTIIRTSARKKRNFDPNAPLIEEGWRVPGCTVGRRNPPL